MRNQYSYEDHKDGTECTYKTLAVTKCSTVLGFSFATLDVINLTKPSNLGGALVVYPKYMVPGITVGLTFGATTCLLTQMRKKDDCWNYFFGGIASGAIMGACRRSFAVAFPCAMTFGTIAAIYKHARQNDFVFFPRFVQNRGNYDSMTWDFTITPDRPRFTVENSK